LARICSDDVIAGLLNRNDIRTGHGNRWTRERVTSLRSHHAIPVYRPETAEADGWMNLTRAAPVLGVSPKTLRLAAEQRQIEAEHPLEEGPPALHAFNIAIRSREMSRRPRPQSPGNPRRTTKSTARSICINDIERWAV
jgi:hypothetical protein